MFLTLSPRTCSYASFKALRTEDDDDDTQWLMYWVVLAMFMTVENLLDMVISW